MGIHFTRISVSASTQAGSSAFIRSPSSKDSASRHLRGSTRPRAFDASLLNQPIIERCPFTGRRIIHPIRISSKKFRHIHPVADDKIGAPLNGHGGRNGGEMKGSKRHVLTHKDRVTCLIPMQRLSPTHLPSIRPQKVGRFGSNRREQPSPTHSARPSPRKGRASWPQGAAKLTHSCPHPKGRAVWLKPP